MGFIIGFGSTEQDFEAAEERAISDHIAARFIALDLSYFTEEFVKEIEVWVGNRGRVLRDADMAYKTAENYPDRYGYHSSTVISDASHIVVILRFLHTNRRHGLSPDGWACLQTRRLFDVVSYEIERAEQAA